MSRLVAVHLSEMRFGKFGHLKLVLRFAWPAILKSL